MTIPRPLPDDFAGTILGCWLQDTPGNRADIEDVFPAETRELREEGVNLFPAPYKDSTPDECHDCRRPIWVGPELRAKQAELTRQGEPCVLMCLFCSAVYSMRVSGGKMPVEALTSKKPGE